MDIKKQTVTKSCGADFPARVGKAFPGFGALKEVENWKDLVQLEVTVK